MKKSKILVPAVALLALSMGAAATGTVAWFSSNKTVTGGTMQIKASSSKSLVISAIGGTPIASDEASSVASANTGLKTLDPASSANGSSFFYVSANGDKVDYSSGALDVGVTLASATPTSTAGASSAQVSKHTFYVRVSGSMGEGEEHTGQDTLTGLYISDISVIDSTNNNAPDSNISKALRVSAVCGSNKFIYAPVSGATTAYKGVSAAGTVSTISGTGTSQVVKDSSSNDLVSSTTVLTAYASTSALAATVYAAEYTQVDLYIWYEGQDAACTTANSINVENLQVAVNFTAI